MANQTAVAPKPVADVDASTQLGEGKLPKGNRIGWARRRLKKGYLLARHGWRCDATPRRMYCLLDTFETTEVLSMKFEGRTEPAKFSRLSWADVDADDWYVVDQLELVR